VEFRRTAILISDALLDSFPMIAGYTLEFSSQCILFYVSYFVLKPLLLVDSLNIIRHKRTKKEVTSQGRKGHTGYISREGNTVGLDPIRGFLVEFLSLPAPGLRSGPFCLHLPISTLLEYY
jgi:hypothetical protein